MLFASGQRIYMQKHEVIFIPANKPLFQVEVEVDAGATVLDALELSGVYHTYPETKDFSIGIFSKTVNLNTVLRPGDRIEIYRELTIDPKEKRKMRAAKSK